MPIMASRRRIQWISKGLTLRYPECTALSAAWGMGGEEYVSARMTVCVCVRVHASMCVFLCVQILG